MHLQEELKKDFSKALDKINIDCYSPFSTKFMEALFIGQMLQSIKLLDEYADIDEELSSANEYFEKYQETKDVSFKEMANDELRHASILIKRMQAKSPSEKLSAYEKERLELQKEFSQIAL